MTLNGRKHWSGALNRLPMTEIGNLMLWHAGSCLAGLPERLEMDERSPDGVPAMFACR
jgi:hypothetical protein